MKLFPVVFHELGGRRVNVTSLSTWCSKELTVAVGVWLEKVLLKVLLEGSWWWRGLLGLCVAAVKGGFENVGFRGEFQI